MFVSIFALVFIFIFGFDLFILSVVNLSSSTAAVRE